MMADAAHSEWAVLFVAEEKGMSCQLWGTDLVVKLHPERFRHLWDKLDAVLADAFLLLLQEGPGIAQDAHRELCGNFVLKKILAYPCKLP